jgi:hypothetical protein
MAKSKIESTPDVTANTEEITTPARGKKIEKKSFSLSDYKAKKGFDKTAKSKPEQWIPVSKAFQEITSLKGIRVSSSYVAFGYQDTGKSTLMLEAAINAQKMGILPVFLVTEQKHSWGHAQKMGLVVNEDIDEDGCVSYSGDFLYFDRNNFNTVEELSKLMHGLMDDQESGKLPMDILFLIDSIGKLNSDKGVKNQQFNPQWVSTSVAHEFGASVIPRVNMTISENKPFTATLFTIVQPWTELPETYGQLPRLTPKAGKSLPQDSAVCIKFGGNTNSGTSKLKVKKKGKEIVWGTRTKVEVEKNHLTNITTRGKLIIVQEGFILEDDAKDYIEAHAKEWLEYLDANSIDELEFEESDGE